MKRITHTPEVLAQFLQLNLNAPTTVAEIVASLEQLQARKVGCLSVLAVVFLLDLSDFASLVIRCCNGKI